MKHLQDTEIIAALKRKDSHLQKVIKPIEHFEDFFQKSMFARIFDAVIQQVFGAQKRDSFRMQIRKFGNHFGPADPLPFLHRAHQNIMGNSALKITKNSNWGSTTRSEDLKAIELLITVCEIALNTHFTLSHSLITGDIRMSVFPTNESKYRHIINELSQLPDIAPTTIALMKVYTMTDLDACPTADYKLAQAVRYLYGGKSVQEVCDKWTPYKSIATWYIWEYQYQRMVKQRSAAFANN